MMLRLAHRALRSRLGRPRPFVLSHLVTARCNADCATCLWKMPASARTDELSTSEVEALYHDAAAAGFVSLVVWGGEPFVRADLGELLRAATSLRLHTTIITNGWWLEERGNDVLPATRRLLLSVDAVGALHDDIRRCPGLFERLARGLDHTLSAHDRVKVTLLAVVSRLNAHALSDVVRFAAEHHVRVIFQAMNASDYGFAERHLDAEHVALSASEQREVARELARLRAAGYPVSDSGAYLTSLGDNAYRYRCHYKKVVLRVEPNGDVLDCTREAAPLTSTRRQSLADFLVSPVFADFARRAQACNRCRDAGVIEASHMWEGRLGALYNAVRTLK